MVRNNAPLSGYLKIWRLLRFARHIYKRYKCYNLKMLINLCIGYTLCALAVTCYIVFFMRHCVYSNDNPIHQLSFLDSQFTSYSTQFPLQTYGQILYAFPFLTGVTKHFTSVVRMKLLRWQWLMSSNFYDAKKKADIIRHFRLNLFVDVTWK